ncbi:pyridoxamine 5'-phosphate oxidase family protein [Paenibacillus frigoriresistens]|uniref:pyridoxamine 5'-phosphate oxidase family protein n=1 Tax=Paenibacillus alginolyticus TaxID=59839 RepID=UPI0015669E69|nr:pyridoxamine 5'-phosphate oxidase family protein [Paenibacillus frigoriresistens]NRF93358.1 pyridoxamine 5'-phosphate oxidase family protein [Paenibacillus frigoriresistens]
MLSFIDNKELITTVEELRSLIGYPSELVQHKVISHIDEHCRDFIAKSPFIFISTSDSTGRCDVSPRGDSAGFIRVVDDKHIVIPERPGNKRMDTLTNIISNPEIGLVFLIPGLGETLRINGRAFVTKDRELLNTMAVNGKIPLLGIVVAIEECFLHCAKAFRRSRLWEPESWLNKDELPSAAKILSSHVKLEGVTAELIAERLEEGYSKRLY